jgi:integral membrane sensor domain MASE1
MWRVPEAVCLLATTVLTSFIVFADLWFRWNDRALGLTFLIFPFIVWASVRFGQFANTLVILVVAAIALWAMTTGLGPFGGALDDMGLAVLQGFLGVLSVSGLLLVPR